VVSVFGTEANYFGLEFLAYQNSLKMQNFEHPHLLKTNLFEQVTKIAIAQHRLV